MHLNLEMSSYVSEHSTVSQRWVSTCVRTLSVADNGCFKRKSLNLKFLVQFKVQSKGWFCQKIEIGTVSDQFLIEYRSTALYATVEFVFRFFALGIKRLVETIDCVQILSRDPTYIFDRYRLLKWFGYDS